MSCITVDLLIQQAVFWQSSAVSLANPTSSLAFTILADGSPPSQTPSAVESSAATPTIDASATNPIPMTPPGAPLASPSKNGILQNSSLNVSSNPLPAPGSLYTFQTCPATAPSQANPSWAALGAGS